MDPEDGMRAVREVRLSIDSDAIRVLDRNFQHASCENGHESLIKKFDTHEMIANRIIELLLASRCLKTVVQFRDVRAYEMLT